MDIDAELLESSILTQWLRRRRKQRLGKRNRRWWMHPVLERRKELGEFAVLFKEYQQKHPDKFRNYMRMDIETFEKLKNLVSPRLVKSSIRESIGAEERLVVTLRYLATGTSFADIAHRFRISTTSVSDIVRECTKAIWESLLEADYIKTPSNTDDWRIVAAEFWSKWQFPNALGCIDGKHVKIKAPHHSGSDFYNFKGTFSINLMAISDADSNFLYVDCGSKGSNCDSTVFATTKLGKMLNQNELDLPPPACLPGTDIKVPYCFLTDGGFPMGPHMVRPFPNKALALRNRVFNYRLSRARRCVESSFGIMAMMWRCLLGTLQCSLETADFVVLACCALTNFVRQYEHRCDTITVDDTADMNPTLQRVKLSMRNRTSTAASVVRDTYADFFMSKTGALDWQWEKARGEQPDTDSDSEPDEIVE